MSCSDKSILKDSDLPKKVNVGSKKSRFSCFFSDCAVALKPKFTINLLYATMLSAFLVLSTEWAARGTLSSQENDRGFINVIFIHFPSFFITFVLLVFAYILLYKLTTLHSVSTLFLGLCAIIPGIVTYYKLEMRSEPFLPWDLIQIDDLMAIGDEVEFTIMPHIVLILFLLLAVVGFSVYIDVLIRKNKKEKKEEKVKYSRIMPMLFSGAGIAAMILLVFLNPVVCNLLGIYPDMWMQDRYYMNHGVITGFLTNLRVLQIDKPSGYSDNKIDEIAKEVILSAQKAEGNNLFSGSPTSKMGATEEQPDIIYVMAEAFWDITQLPNITYDQEITPNLDKLREEAVYGESFSPSFGGGTCDVEFEVLTGFSMQNLPSGCKPYQQYIREGMFSLPNFLLDEGYDNLAIHGYGSRFWNRDKAYPNLGLDEFISSEDFINPEYMRKLISDKSVIERIIYEHVARSKNDAPMFIHTVTMQNHSTYNRDKYPSDYIVNITSAPSTFSTEDIGKIEDFATGIRDMDAAIGILTDYLRTTSRKTILVFWGDHMNNVTSGLSLFEKTGLIEQGDTANPEIYKTPLLMWSNYSTVSKNIGDISAYNISPVMMELYGLEKPLYFEYLVQQTEFLHGRSRGTTISTDGGFSEYMSEAQQKAFDTHAMLQYDLMFGNGKLMKIMKAEQVDF